ncbi:hypothetical protein CMEL01_01810, partial [Colletotrichum melonis]
VHGSRLVISPRVNAIDISGLQCYVYSQAKPLTPATNCHRGHDMRLLDVQISTKRQFGSFPQAWEPKIEGRWLLDRSEYHSTTIDAVHHHTNPNFSNSLVVPCVLPLALLSAAPTNRHDYSSLR